MVTTQRGGDLHSDVGGVGKRQALPRNLAIGLPTSVRLMLWVISGGGGPIAGRKKVARPPIAALSHILVIPW